MEENNNNNPVQPEEYTIDWMGLFKTLLSKWKVLVLVGAISFVVMAALQLCIPNYYEVTVKLSPELGSKGGGGGLAAMASSLGFDISSATGSNTSALMPSIYPDIVSAPDFAVGLFDVEVRTKDGEYVGPYYDYLLEHQKGPFWSKAMKGISKGIGAVISLILPKDEEEEEGSAGNGGANVFRLTKKQAEIAKAINEDNVSCDVDKKMGTITLHIADQDPQICGMLADSVCTHLQNFITEYHTRKATLDSEYFKQLMDSAQIAYEEAVVRYSRYAEEHTGLTLERYKIEQQNLQMDMTLKQNIFTTFQKQYLQAEAQIQESKPAFTTIQAPAIPTKKAGPSRAKNVLMFTFLALVVASVILVRKQIDWKALIS